MSLSYFKNTCNSKKDCTEMNLNTNDKRILFVTNSDRSTVTTSLVDLKPGDKVIVETLCTKSEATVVWQDGSIGKVIF